MSVSLVKTYVAPSASTGRFVQLPGRREVLFVREALSGDDKFVLLRVTGDFGSRRTTSALRTDRLTLVG